MANKGIGIPATYLSFVDEDMARKIRSGEYGVGDVITEIKGIVRKNDLGQKVEELLKEFMNAEGIDEKMLESTNSMRVIRKRIIIQNRMYMEIGEKIFDFCKLPEGQRSDGIAIRIRRY